MDAQELKDLDSRSAAFIIAVVKAAMLNDASDMGDPVKFWKDFTVFMADAGAVRMEVTRLAAMRQAIRDLHVPMGGRDGQALCTGCSVGGGEVTWPCATWKITDTA